MWIELGSSSYEAKTYAGLLRLIEWAEDPDVVKRATMFMDLAMMEIEQTCISNIRGGSKSRAKEGGVRSDFDYTRALFHGDYHFNKLEPPGLKVYEPSAPPLLFRKLGPTTPVYEIINRHVGEMEAIEPDYVPQYDAVKKLRSRSINYAWCTPEYITGCAMFDVRLWEGEGKGAKLKYGTMGRWSGVIFRNLAAIELPAYAGEKYNVQSKDVMIAQLFHGNYFGHPQVAFTFIMNMVEKDGWVFVENQEAYAAVRVARGGYYWSEPARRHLFLNDWFSPVIIQTGRQVDYGTFERFQRAILAAPFRITEDVLDYTGPNSSRIEFFLCRDSVTDPVPESLPRIDGIELDLNLKHNYKSPYINNTVGSDIVTITYGDREWKYDFENNTVTENTVTR